jgi:hypothetical protein
MPFDTPHNQAFEALGALPPYQHWSAFDVTKERALVGEARRLVTSIWNFDSIVDHSGVRKPTTLAICKDQTSGEFWYRTSRPRLGTMRRTWVAHWNRISLAIDCGIPIVGVLKDVRTGNCSLENIFDCDHPRHQSDGSALWLRLVPRTDVGCSVRLVDIDELTSDATAWPEEGAERELHDAVQRSTHERRARLAEAPKFPRAVWVTSREFARNPDVIAETLFRAEGVCEGCKNLAPFKRQSDGTPYLEVHHRIPLSLGGEDTLENTFALCPNCHRRAHFG